MPQDKSALSSPWITNYFDTSSSNKDNSLIATPDKMNEQKSVIHTTGHTIKEPDQTIKEHGKTLKEHGKVVFEHVTKFGKSTSIKGIPRIVTSERFYIKILWFGAVCCFLTFAILQALTLLETFLQNRILVVTEEHPFYDKIIEKYRDDPPAFTVCDAHASAYPQQAHELELETAEEWYDRYELMYETAIASEEGQAISAASEFDFVFSRLASTGYLETMGLGAKHVFSKIAPDFIVHCTLQVAPPSDMNDFINCDDWVIFKNISTPLYPTCYTGYLNHSLMDTFYDEYQTYILGYKLVIYTGDLEETLNFGWSDVNKILSDKNGVLFGIHNVDEEVPHSFLDLMAPGFVHVINADSYIRERINDGGTMCREDRWASYRGLHDDQWLLYTNKMCYTVCVIERVLSQCGCLKLDATVAIEGLSNDSQYCGFLGNNLTETLTRLECSMAVSAESTDDCYDNCPIPCKEAIHSYTHSFTRWPTRQQKLHFYENFIRNRSFEGRFQFYEEAWVIALEDIDTALDMLQEDTLIEENFLQISILNTQTTVLRLYDVYQMPLISFIGQLGGVLNLYAGITVVVLVEILEFITRLVHPCVKRLVEKCKGRCSNKIDTTGSNAIKVQPLST